MNSQLTILSVPIGQVDGLYRLNDLHRAGGGEEKHKPTNFMRNDRTQSLIFEIERCSDLSSAIRSKEGGTDQGTYVCKELVYAYAMWVSARFHLLVIRAFDAMQSQTGIDQGATITVDQSDYITLLKDKISLLENANAVKVRKNFTDAERQSMIEWFDAGVSYSVIADRLNRSRGSVGSFIWQYRRAAQ